MVRGYRDISTPEGKYTPRTWTKAPPEQHTVTYEGTRYGYRRCQTMVHNPRTELFELKHSPIASPTVKMSYLKPLWLTFTSVSKNLNALYYYTNKNLLSEILSGEKSNKCDQCSAVFPKKSELIRHYRIHTGNNLYFISITKFDKLQKIIRCRG